MILHNFLNSRTGKSFRPSKLGCAESLPRNWYLRLKSLENQSIILPTRSDSLAKDVSHGGKKMWILDGLKHLNNVQEAGLLHSGALRSQIGHEPPLLRHTLSLDNYSSYEDAMQAGERFANQFELGKVPALRLAEVMERELDILVLMVDATDGVSGAACHLPNLDAVLIARREVAGRRHFDLAHELFHILTWEAMPPKHLEESEGKSRNRVEQLANNFAAAVLMPSEILDQFGDWSELAEKKLIARLNFVANRLYVTSSALRWRLTTLGKLKKTVANSLPEIELRNNGRDSITEKVPPALFSPSFMEVIGNGIKEGKVSIRRLARLFDMSTDNLSNLFAEHGLESPVFL